MRKTLSFLVMCCLCIGSTGAVVRTTNSSARTAPVSESRTATSRGEQSVKVSRTAETPSRSVTARATTNSQQVTSRTATPATTRTAPAAQTPSVSRVAAKNARTVRTQNTQQTSRTSRAATSQTTAFSTGYNACRDAYFTCMDQFCATANDSYRRCVCSSRLYEIRKKQRALDDASDQIQTFKDLNIEVIPKTAAEVNAMLSASEGEFAASIAKDTSESAQKLAGISAVLTKTKSKSLSTAGTLDIAGDINAIWATTDLTSGANIANLTGETLYNAVHAQCAELVADHCESRSTLNMVIAAYSMYIENDCTLLSTALGTQKNNANAAIRETEREMHAARLDNYNAHNATSINDCVAKVRSDITKDNACGTDYIHCLDVSGLYLNKITGEPIYSANFYQLETMVSLSGDILTNNTNRMLVAELNRKRSFAEKSLSTCQDLADDVWNEFVRQAITEIYQGQQSRIRQVKDECLDVVNKCYDSQKQSLRDFSNTNQQLLLGSQLELSESLCQEKLSACSNLYGGGAGGMRELVATMYNITSQTIAQDCLTALKDYAETLCAVPSSDTLHYYPYACRVYAPGDQKYATVWSCQNKTQNDAKNIPWASDTYNQQDQEGTYTNQEDLISPDNPWGTQTTSNISSSRGYQCETIRRYVSCDSGYFLSDCYEQSFWEQWHTNSTSTVSITNPHIQNRCVSCIDGYTCQGNAICPQLNATETQTQEPSTQTPDEPEEPEQEPNPCSDYVGSLYQKIVRYAMQACMRPSETEKIEPDRITTPISPTVLQDVNATMDSIRIAMSNSLQAECERLGGYWVATQYTGQDGTTTNGSNIKPYPHFLFALVSS